MLALWFSVLVNATLNELVLPTLGLALLYFPPNATSVVQFSSSISNPFFSQLYVLLRFRSKRLMIKFILVFFKKILKLFLYNLL